MSGPRLDADQTDRLVRAFGRVSRAEYDYALHGTGEGGVYVNESIAASRALSALLYGELGTRPDSWLCTLTQNDGTEHEVSASAATVEAAAGHVLRIWLDVASVAFHTHLTYPDPLNSRDFDMATIDPIRVYAHAVAVDTSAKA